MILNKNVKSTIKPEKISMDLYHVYVRTNIHTIDEPHHVTNTDLQTNEVIYEYDEETYNKDEYIHDKINNLENTLAQQDELIAMMLLEE